MFKRFGVTTIHHVAYLVRTGMLRGAVSFFVDQLGWSEVDKMTVTGDWGTARFVKSSGGSVLVQLTEELEWPDDPQIFVGTHLALAVGNAAEAAELIDEWAQHAGINCEIEAANASGSKWFVRLPDVFTFAFEFVSTGA